MPGPDEVLNRSTGVYVCDLPPGLTELNLRHVFGHYGDIVSLTQFSQVHDEAAFIEYTATEAAEEARATVNHASVRGKTCRCISSGALEVVCSTMEAGHRLVIEGLDPAIESRGLLDVCALFGRVLDCKVELDEKERSRGFGFAHFLLKEEAAKAMTFLNRMQIGDSVLEVRFFERKDAALFTGCSYAGGPGRPMAADTVLPGYCQAIAGSFPGHYSEGLSQDSWDQGKGMGHDDYANW